MAFAALRPYQDTILRLRREGVTLEAITAHLKETCQFTTSAATLSRFLKSLPVEAPVEVRQAAKPAPQTDLPIRVATLEAELKAAQEQIEGLTKQLRNAATSLLDAHQESAKRQAALEQQLEETKRALDAAVRDQAKRLQQLETSAQHPPKTTKVHSRSPQPKRDPRREEKVANSTDSAVDRLLAGEAVDIRPTRRLFRWRVIMVAGAFVAISMIVLAILL